MTAANKNIKSNKRPEFKQQQRIRKIDVKPEENQTATMDDGRGLSSAKRSA